MTEFFETRMGQKFYEGTMPRIASALEDLVKVIRNERETPESPVWELILAILDDDERSPEEKISRMRGIVKSALEQEQ